MNNDLLLLSFEALAAGSCLCGCFRDIFDGSRGWAIVNLLFFLCNLAYWFQTYIQLRQK